MRKTIKVSNIDCAQCAKTIEHHFKTKEDIEAKVLVTSKKVIFTYNESKYTTDDLAKGLYEIGYRAILNSEEQLKAKKKDQIDLWVALLFSIPLLWTMFHHLGITWIFVPEILMNGYFQLAMTVPVLFYSGRRFFKAAYYQVKMRNLGMDTLVVIGTMAAFIYSIYLTLNHSMHLYFETTSVIILMVLIGNFFENRVKERTSDALQTLVTLGAKEARVIKNGLEQMVSVDAVQIDDVVIVLAGEKVPVDGIIVKGKTYIDESMLTGEAMPSFKEIGQKVIGSSMNLVETIWVKVDTVGSDTVLAKIIQTVEETALIKPKAQRVADKIAKWFVPVVVVISVAFFILWSSTENANVAFERAIAILVISCPCALGLATPTSISVASGIAFKSKILYRGGEFFETANKIDAIAFDKTGTLTKGHPELLEVIGNKEAYAYTASLEKHSTHPIAKAITDAYDKDYLEVSNYETLLGQGIKGMIEEKEVFVGSYALVKALNIEVPFDYETYQKQGHTVFFTIINGMLENMVVINDPLKETAIKTIKTLQKRGITPYMITGDQELTAHFIAQKLGITHVYASVLPHEKAEIIREIKEKHQVVAFVGDGINDAPALKMADVGFAIGTGADVAIDSSDVTLMSYDLGLVIDAIDLSKSTLRNIYLNFLWAFLYNVIMIPFAALGFLNPTYAGIGMGFSSIMVVLNALSLKLFKFKNKERDESDEH